MTKFVAIWYPRIIVIVAIGVRPVIIVLVIVASSPYGMEPSGGNRRMWREAPLMDPKKAFAMQGGLKL